jgi:hypothetical protein
MPCLLPLLFAEFTIEELRRKYIILALKNNVIRIIFSILYGSADIPNERNVFFDRLYAMIEDML